MVLTRGLVARLATFAASTSKMVGFDAEEIPENERPIIEDEANPEAISAYRHQH